MHILKSTRKMFACAAQPSHWLILAYKIGLSSFIDLIISSSKDKVHEGSFFATSYYICNLWLITVPNGLWKKSHHPFSWIFNGPKTGKKPKNSKIRHFSPIFGDKLIHWNMKSQTRHKDILARQCENTPLSTGDNEKGRVWDFILQVYHRKWG